MNNFYLFCFIYSLNPFIAPFIPSYIGKGRRKDAINRKTGYLFLNT